MQTPFVLTALIIKFCLKILGNKDVAVTGYFWIFSGDHTTANTNTTTNTILQTDLFGVYLSKHMSILANFITN